MALTKDKVDFMKGLLAKSNSDVLGNCMFCEKPIILTKEQIEKEVTDFAIIVQRLYFHLHGSHIQNEIQAFLMCRECSLSQYKLKIAKQLGEIHIDLGKVNDSFSKALAKAAIREQAEKALAEQLKIVEKPIEEKRDEKVPSNT